MKQLTSPAYDLKLVRYLTRRMTAATATSMWKRTTGRPGALKSSMTKLMLIEQSKRCAYCGSRLFESHPARDHIAPKEVYFKWTFWPENLVLACFACNTDQKKSYDPVIACGSSYRNTTFKFVHPYLDDPTLHIKFTGHRLKILISAASSSAKGQETINLFDLASTERSKQRAKDALLDQDIEHLHGKWKRLFELVVSSPFSERLVMKMF
ncbi:HNH endonuclease [Pseudomonas sp. MAFF 311095]|uniref:HNH endonuclease n=1 Tax=Pseudomonas petroselini TaxID=2899822 RepID=A0ABS8QWT3_9PSED|nr:HNH endonuclease [Pseudomonas petroselini]MCD7040137.1 HNH endonuclease [Pseudomonas petroselini]MCD7043583.1 HNH endonuclease [Pseudomonas petroselini]MCD7069726.1 HNH endonuclease [Pseudomonas petroselini]MCD7077758.1 HNH endonuclease [Pseudomonas petroselini]